VTDRCRGRRFLITGASGFIGRAVCGRLLELGGEVCGSSRTPVEFASEKWQHLPADLSSATEVDRILETARPEFVIHLAGCVTGKREVEWVRETFAGNLESAVNVLVAAHRLGVSKTVLSGSLEEPAAGESFPVPTSPYAASKWCASGYARMMHALYAMNVAVARIFMVYGPGQNDLTKLIPYVCLSAARGESPKLTSGGRLVDWVFVDDVVEGLIRLALGGPNDGSHVDLGTGELVSTGEVARTICGIAGTGVAPEVGALPDRRMEQVRKADPEATRATLDWTATTSLTTGLRRTFEWYRDVKSVAEGSVS